MLGVFKNFLAEPCKYQLKCVFGVLFGFNLGFSNCCRSLL